MNSYVIPPHVIRSINDYNRLRSAIPSNVLKYLEGDSSTRKLAISLQPKMESPFFRHLLKNIEFYEKISSSTAYKNMQNSMRIARQIELQASTPFFNKALQLQKRFSDLQLEIYDSNDSIFGKCPLPNRNKSHLVKNKLKSIANQPENQGDLLLNIHEDLLREYTSKYIEILQYFFRNTAFQYTQKKDILIIKYNTFKYKATNFHKSLSDDISSKINRLFLSFPPDITIQFLDRIPNCIEPYFLFFAPPESYNEFLKVRCVYGFIMFLLFLKPSLNKRK